jgi:hypothetical protein
MLGHAVMLLAATFNIAVCALHAPAMPWALVALPVFSTGMIMTQPSLQLLALDCFPERHGLASRGYVAIHSLAIFSCQRCWLRYLGPRWRSAWQDCSCLAWPCSLRRNVGTPCTRPRLLKNFYAMPSGNLPASRAHPAMDRVTETFESCDHTETDARKI